MKHVLTLAALLFFGSHLYAQESVVWVACDAKAGTLVIRYTVTPDSEDPPWPGKQMLYS